MSQYKTILVAVDLSEVSDQIIKKAQNLAATIQAALYLINVVEQLPVTTYPFFGSMENIETQMMEEATSKMRKRSEQACIPVSHQIVELGIPKITLLEKAKALQADLIVIGSHTKHGFSRFLGSTATSVVNNAECDVFVIHTHK